MKSDVKRNDLPGEETESASMSRRDFFKATSLAVGGVAAASIIPQALAQAPDRTDCQPEDWELTPAPIAAAEIKQTVNVDVLVVGCGLAGTICAIVAKQNGAGNVQIIEKNTQFAARGAHITAFDTNVQRTLKIKQPNYRQIIREWVRWAQGRVDEDLLWLFAHKSGAAFDWLEALMKPRGLRVGLWNEYYKGPDYTEYPVTHIFEDTKSKERGNVPLVARLVDVCNEMKIPITYRMKATQFVRESDGRISSLIAGQPGNYTKYVAKKGIVIAAGDYASNHAMTARYCPIANLADAQIYFPNKCNTGDLHLMAMHVGGAMQKVEPHAAVIHLEAGAMSYGFLHVNALGKRFKNEDVNTQSKSCSKLLEKNGIAWTIYDADGLAQVQQQIDKGIAGGLFYGQMMRFWDEKWSMKEEQDLLELNIKEGKVVRAATLQELAINMKLDYNAQAEFLKTVDNYNNLAKAKNDTDYGKRVELLAPVVKPPFYAGQLRATVLTMAGGLRTNPTLQVLDGNDNPMPGLYVVGAAAGNFFAADYPTICPGIGHGRCVTFGYLAGLLLAGKTFDQLKSIKV